MNSPDPFYVLRWHTAAGDRLYLHLRDEVPDLVGIVGGELSNAAWIAPDGLFRMQIWLDQEHTRLQHYTVCPGLIIALYWWDATQETWRTGGTT